MDSAHGQRSRTRRVGLVALLWLLGLCAFSQTNTLGGYGLEISSSSLRQGQRFSISLELPLAADQVLLFDSLVLPQGLSLLQGPERSNLEDGLGPSSGVGRTRITWYLRGDSPGWKRLPSFTVRALPQAGSASQDGAPGIGAQPSGQGNGTSPQTFQVLETALPILPSGNASRVPPDLRWRIGQTGLLQGQSTAVILELSSMTEYILPEAVNFSAPERGVFEEVSGLGSVNIEQFGGMSFQSYPVAAFILTPSDPGSLRIPPATVTIYGQSVQAPALISEVVSLPEELTQNSAIGNFVLSGVPAANSVRMGEILRFTMRLEGEGNFNYLSLPQIQLDGARVSAQSESFRFTPAAGGYRGFMELTYRIIPEREGSMSIQLPPFSWYRPDDGRIQRSAGQSFSISVDPAVINTRDGQAGLSPLSPAQVQAARLLDLWLRPEIYLLIIPAAFIGLGLYLSERRKGRGISRTGTALLVLSLLSILLLPSAAVPRKGLGDWDAHEELEALRLIAQEFQEGRAESAADANRELIESSSLSNPALLYNQGIYLAAADKRAEAVFYFRQALRVQPSNAEFRRALLEVESAMGLDRQFSVPSLPLGDYFFLLFLAVLISFLLFLPFWLRRLSTFKIVGLVLLLVLALGSLTLVGLYQNVRFAEEAVVREGESPGQLKKIPEARASDWLNLPPGTSVRIGDWSGDYALIATAYGIEGWIARDEIWSREEGSW